MKGRNVACDRTLVKKIEIESTIGRGLAAWLRGEMSVPLRILAAALKKVFYQLNF